MAILAADPTVVHVAADDAGTLPPGYVWAADGETVTAKTPDPAVAASAPWSEQDRREWAACEMRDAMRENCGGW